MTEVRPNDDSAGAGVSRAGLPLLRRVAAGFATAVVACCLALAGSGNTQAQTSVRDVDTPSRQPFQAQVVNQGIDENRPTAFALVAVPAGKRFVVEHVSLRVLVPPSPTKLSIVQARLLTQLGGQTVDHVLVLGKLTELAANRAEVFEASQPIRAYADAGTTVSVSLVFDADGREPVTAIVNRLSVSGHFVDLAP